MNDSGPAVSADERLIRAAQRQADALRRRQSDAPTGVGSSQRVALSPPVAPPRSAEFPGYEITGEVHRGGQGVVYRGVHRATRREVAIKVLRAGVHASAYERFRFEREAQILAQLRHPNIVTVHDSGVVGEYAYLVMDYIAGQPLDEFVPQRRKSGEDTAAALRLFATVCEAVHAAHLRGVIHRDLKPANIRVDEKGEPHVLDFGLAKLVQGEEAGGSSDAAMTQTGQFVGSLPWAAPEQAAGRPDQIDIRSDVYSLGVILYQTLTGCLPHPATGGIRQVLERIQHAEPPRPRTLCPSVNDELETIALKCLAKERERRYQSAGELARDIRNYLAGEAIEAKRDSIAYVLRKQFRRHRLPVAVAVGFVLVVTAGFLASAFFWQQAAQQRDDARTARDQQARLRALAEGNEHTARDEAAKAQAVTDFLRTLLTSADPALTHGREVTVREVLDRAAAQVNADAPARPDIEAAVRQTVGESYIAVGAYAQAESMLRRAAELSAATYTADDRRTLEARTALARAVFFASRYAEAEALFRDILAALERAAEPDAVWRLKLENNLGFALLEQNKLEEAEALLRRVVQEGRQVLGPDHMDTLTAANSLGVVLRMMRRYAEAEGLQRQALDGQQRALGEEHPSTLKVMHNLALTLREARQYEEAEALHRRALEIKLRVLGEEHPDTLTTLNGLTLVLWSQDRREEAAEITRRLADIQRRVLGRVHQNTLVGENNLANMLKGLGRLDELEALLWQVVETRRGLLGEDHAETIRVVDYLRDTLRIRQKPDELRSFVGDVIERWQQIAQRPDATPAALNRYARLLLTCEPEDLRDPVAALSAAERAVEAAGGVAQLDTLAQALSMNGQLDRAIQTQRQAVAQLPPGESRPRAELEEGLAELLRQSGDLDGALDLMRDVLARRRASWPEGHSEIAVALALHGALLIDAQQFAEAETALRECLEIRQRRLGGDHWLTANTLSLLGAALTGLGHFEEAEPLALRGYQGLRDNPETPETRRREARARLVRLYEAWGRPAQAAEWSDGP